MYATSNFIIEKLKKRHTHIYKVGKLELLEIEKDVKDVKRLPKILKTDPVAKHMNLEEGQVLRMGKNFYYCIVDKSIIFDY
tara:strand:- start:6509 stop:6751 length:243 start_codon:yes stop_codon:yes gene_type:complete